MPITYLKLGNSLELTGFSDPPSGFICLEVDRFDDAVNFLKSGVKVYRSPQDCCQTSARESWREVLKAQT